MKGNKKTACGGTQTVKREQSENERIYMDYITKTDEEQEEIECEDYDYFTDGYPRYEEYDEFAGWRDLVI